MGFTATGFATKGTKTIVNITAFKALCSAMAVKPRSKSELHEITGLTNTTVSRWVTVLSSGKDRILYISDYKRVGGRGCWTAMFSLGYGLPDAVRPKALTNAEYLVNYRKKLAASTGPSTARTSTGLIHRAGFEKPVPKVRPGPYHSPTHSRGPSIKRKETTA